MNSKRFVAEAEGGGQAIRTIGDVVCTFCACTCDDIVLKVQGERIVDVENACEAGRRGFLDYQAPDGPACRIDGEPAEPAEGICRAAEILARALCPIVYGLIDTTCEAQRAAAAVADWVGATIDTPAGTRHGIRGMAFQSVGEVTATLGEIRDRADLIVFWRTNPTDGLTGCPADRFLMRRGMFRSGGREDRTFIVVDHRADSAPEVADWLVAIRPDGETPALWTLRALAAGIDLDSKLVEQQTGVALSAWRELMERMKAARYGVILFGGESASGKAATRCDEALLALTRDMNRHTRFVCKAIVGRSNGMGAENVLAWRTGFPFGVNLARGYPRFCPGEFTVNDVLARGEADAAMFVGRNSAADLSGAAREHLESIPLITLGHDDLPTDRRAAVAFTTARFGVNTSGTVHRIDGVPLPLRPVVESPYPSDAEVLGDIETEVRRLKAGMVG